MLAVTTDSVAEMVELFLERPENALGKEENACLPQCL